MSDELYKAIHRGSIKLKMKARALLLEWDPKDPEVEDYGFRASVHFHEAERLERQALRASLRPLDPEDLHSLAAELDLHLRLDEPSEDLDSLLEQIPLAQSPPAVCFLYAGTEYRLALRDALERPSRLERVRTAIYAGLGQLHHSIRPSRVGLRPWKPPQGRRSVVSSFGRFAWVSTAAPERRSPGIKKPALEAGFSVDRRSCDFACYRLFPPRLPFFAAFRAGPGLAAARYCSARSPFASRMPSSCKRASR